MKKTLIILSVLLLLGYGFAERQRYLFFRSCVENSTGNTVSVPVNKCKAPNYTFVRRCYDNVEKKDVDISFCEIK